MELIEIPKDELFLGMSLEYTLRDASGLVLLTKAHKIETQQQLDAIKSRQRVYVDIDQTGGGVRAVMSSLSALDHAGAPIKDFTKFLNLKKAAQTEDTQSGNLAQRWGDVESKLGGLLASVETTDDFSSRLVLLDDRIRQLLGWRPHHDDLETIVATQLAWERTLQARPELCRN